MSGYSFLSRRMPTPAGFCFRSISNRPSLLRSIVTSPKGLSMIQQPLLTFIARQGNASDKHQRASDHTADLSKGSKSVRIVACSIRRRITRDLSSEFSDHDFQRSDPPTRPRLHQALGSCLFAALVVRERAQVPFRPTWQLREPLLDDRGRRLPHRR